jgi:SET domain-containing protein
MIDGVHSLRNRVAVSCAPRYPCAMLLVKTYVDKSPIHGLGVFAAETIRKGQPIWRYVEGFDRCWTPAQFARLPRQAREFLRMHAYKIDGEIIFTVDHDHHMNHSDDANTHWHRGCMRARRAIAEGQEITNDYRDFEPALCAEFLAPNAKSKKR